jgi:hypothetical protein
MFSVALYSWLAVRIFRLTRPKSQEIDIIINGLIPSKPNASTKEDSGTTILLFSGDGSNKVIESQIIARGFADEKGEFRASVDRSLLGETVTCRIRHAAYKFKDDQILIMDYGAFHTANMEPDFVYDYRGFVRGADVGDLKAYTDSSVKQGNNYRRQAFDRLRMTGIKLGEIPFLYWLRYYLLGIMAFALDYFFLGAHFDRNITGFVDPLYFSVVTITTLGYGEIVPTHDVTKLLTSLQATSGVVLVGLFLNSLFADRS